MDVYCVRFKTSCEWNSLVVVCCFVIDLVIKLLTKLATYGTSMLASDSDMYMSQVTEFVKELASGDLPRSDV